MKLDVEHKWSQSANTTRDWVQKDLLHKGRELNSAGEGGRQVGRSFKRCRADGGLSSEVGVITRQGCM